MNTSRDVGADQTVADRSACLACGGELGAHFAAREMMQGTREVFRYAACRSCRSVQLLDVPEDLTPYYSSEYYAFPGSIEELWEGEEGQLRRERDRYAVLGHGTDARSRYPVGYSRYREFPETAQRSLAWAGATAGDSVLDVGAGSGLLAYALVEIGFRDVLGIDPFLPNDVEYANGLRILRRSIHELDGRWRIVMFHHSFEHAVDPVETLQAAAARLLEDGVVVIRMPTVSSLAWRRYRTDWVQLDPPRHICVPSRIGIRAMARRAGLEVVRVVDDSTAFQFWGSEQYRRGIALTAPQSFAVDPGQSQFDPRDIERYERWAGALNALHLGDQAAFVLRKRSPDRG